MLRIVWGQNFSFFWKKISNITTISFAVHIEKFKKNQNSKCTPKEKKTRRKDTAVRSILWSIVIRMDHFKFYFFLFSFFQAIFLAIILCIRCIVIYHSDAYFVNKVRFRFCSNIIQCHRIISQREFSVKWKLESYNFGC